MDQAAHNMDQAAHNMDQAAHSMDHAANVTVLLPMLQSCYQCWQDPCVAGQKVTTHILALPA